MADIINNILGNIDDDDIRDIIELMIHTGRRPKEILRLRKSDIDFSKKEIIFQNMKKGTFESIVMSDEAFQVLKRRMK